MELLLPGTIIEAVVERIEPFGAWINHEGRRGLIELPEVSWSRIRHPGEALAVGQRVRVCILSVADDRFSASIRAADPESDPWRDPAQFREGTLFHAPVVLETDYGCFVELRPAVWGLLPRQSCPEGLRVGERLHVVVKSADTVNRKIEVSLRSPIPEA